jgi:hypothetical protein
MGKSRIVQSELKAALGHRKFAWLMRLGQSGGIACFTIGALMQAFWDQSGNIARALLAIGAAVSVVALVFPILIFIRTSRKLRRPGVGGQREG